MKTPVFCLLFLGCALLLGSTIEGIQAKPGSSGPSPESELSSGRFVERQNVLDQSDNLGPLNGYFGVDWEDPHQVMEGMGGAISWYGAWALDHPNRDAIMDAVFSDLRPSVLRVRNTFQQGNDHGGDGGQTSAQLMKETAQVIQEGRKRLGGREAFKLLMCSWSPPVSLKVSGKLNGAGSGAGEADTLKKDERGVFIYKEFAQYWLQSLQRYEQIGVKPDWISIQNEPDWSTPEHPVCSFRPAESFFYPGYYRAFDEVFETLKSSLSEMPEMIGPETAGFDDFVTAPLNGRKEGYQAAPYSGSPRVSAICNHLYDAGIKYSDQDFYLKLDQSLRNVRRQADETMTRRVFMTEFANLANHEYTDPMNLARTIYQTLTIADAAMYLQWDLLWGRSNEGTLVIVDNPYDGIDTEQTWGFERTMSFYWFKHFCRFIRPGMQRYSIRDKTDGLNGVLPLVFLSKVHDGSSTVILINTEDQWTRVHLGYLPNPVEGKPREVYYSTLDEGFVHAGRFPEDSNKIWLKPNSITTLHSGDN